MAETFLTLTNKVLARLNEVQLTSTSFATARGIQVQAKKITKISHYGKRQNPASQFGNRHGVREDQVGTLSVRQCP